MCLQNIQFTIPNSFKIKPFQIDQTVEILNAEYLKTFNFIKKYTNTCCFKQLKTQYVFIYIIGFRVTVTDQKYFLLIGTNVQ